jgi:hypothetical protein
MFGAAFALIVVGIILMFVIPWGVGIVVGIVGIVLLVMSLLGFGRRAARGEQPTRPPT